MADRDTRLAELVGEGMTIREAAALLGLARSTAYDRLVSVHDRARRPRLTPAERERIITLIDSGRSRESVAREVGRAKSTVVAVDLDRRDDGRIARVRSARRCPQCGARLNVVQCLKCQLLGSR